MTTSAELAVAGTMEDPLARREAELDTLAAVAARLAHEGGSRHILAQLLDQLEQRLGVVRSAVTLVARDGSEMTIEASRRGIRDIHRGNFLRHGAAAVGTVLQTGRPVIIAPIDREPRFDHHLDARGADAPPELGHVCVPILLDGGVVGTLSAETPWSHESPWEDRGRLLGIVADLIAMAAKARRCTEVAHRRIEAQQAEVPASHEPLSPAPRMPVLHAPEDLHSLPARVALLERQMIIDALKTSGGNVAAAARDLSLTPRIIRYKIKKLGIDSRRAVEVRRDNASRHALVSDAVKGK